MPQNQRKIFDIVSNGVGRAWSNLANHLGLGHNEVQEIEDMYKEHSRRCFEVLTRWGDRNGREATLQVLIDALITIDKKLVAEEIEVYADFEDTPDLDTTVPKTRTLAEQTAGSFKDPKTDVTKHFGMVIKKVGIRWKDLAEELGFSFQDIEVVEHNIRHRDDKDKCRELLHKWHQRNGREATDKLLKDALVRAGLKSVAQDIDNAVANGHQEL
ncbi:Glutamate receptor ionotropic, NMDA 2B [Branchiostoma belcheri]|nr:Glutamate receptor ionotropic, NMDA 2B [Branchiostoma belcheri]